MKTRKRKGGPDDGTEHFETCGRRAVRELSDFLPQYVSRPETKLQTETERSGYIMKKTLSALLSDYYRTFSR